MKVKILLLSLLLLVGCNNHQNQSNKLIIKDSLQIAKEKEIAEVQAYANRPWKLNTFVDEFGDPSKDKFIETRVEGTFSNSATAGSYLFAEVLITKSSAGIFLHEYRITSPAEKFIGLAKIMLKNSKDEILTINSHGEWSKSGGIKVENWDIGPKYDYYTILKDFIQKSTGEIKVVVNDEYSSAYKFTIDATGFTKEFSLL